MGQYFIILNLTKKQFINPNEFDDGSKLVEFGSSSDGTMFALAALSVSGNGRGGGDIFSPRYVNAVKKWHSCVKKPRYPNADALNDPIIGSWAGDRILIAGDYISPQIFLTLNQQNRLSKVLAKRYDPTADCVSKATYIKKNLNIYQYALAFFKDISADIIAVLKDAKVNIRDGSELRENLQKRKMGTV